MSKIWDTYDTKAIKEKYLFRFTSSKWALKFLQTADLSFARVDTFENKLEGIATAKIFNFDARLSNKEIHKVRTDLLKYQRKNFVHCFYLSNRESVVMWDLYCKEDGVALRFDRQQLQNRVKALAKRNDLARTETQMIAGRIKYVDFRKIPNNTQKNLIKYLAFRKDESFRHEREYRFVMTLNEEVHRERLSFSLGSLNNLDIKVIASPRVGVKELKDIAGRIREINSKLKLEQSELMPWFQFMNDK